MAFDANQCLSLFERLLAADSTTGQYAAVQKVVTDLLDEWGVPYDLVHKGGVIARLGTPSPSRRIWTISASWSAM